MEERRAYRYRIYPTREQADLINKTIGCARLLYNLTLEDLNQQCRQGVNSPKMKKVTFFYGEFPFLREVDSLALANAQQNLRQSISNYFDWKKGKRKGQRVGYPKRHTKNRSRWTYTTNNQHGTVRLEGGLLKLPKLGRLEINLHRPLDGVITAATIERTRSNEYYVSLKVITDIEAVSKNITAQQLHDVKVVGLDMSMSEFVVDSDGHGFTDKEHTQVDGNLVKADDTKAKFVRLTRKHEKKRRVLARKLSRTMKGSGNRERARKRLARLDSRIANSRKDFCHKASKHYASNYDVIMVEDISMQGMSRSLRLGKSVGDLGFGMFRNFLSYKCRKYDSVLIYVDKWFASSKTCHECGTKNDNLKLSDREWVCKECGCILDRDLNAALNLRDYYYTLLNSTTVGTTGSYACGDEASTLRDTLMQALSMKHETEALGKEAPSFRWG